MGDIFPIGWYYLHYLLDEWMARFIRLRLAHLCFEPLNVKLTRWAAWQRIFLCSMTHNTETDYEYELGSPIVAVSQCAGPPLSVAYARRTDRNPSC